MLQWYELMSNFTDRLEKGVDASKVRKPAADERVYDMFSAQRENPLLRAYFANADDEKFLKREDAVIVSLSDTLRPWPCVVPWKDDANQSDKEVSFAMKAGGGRGDDEDDDARVAMPEKECNDWLCRCFCW